MLAGNRKKLAENLGTKANFKKANFSPQAASMVGRHLDWRASGLAGKCLHRWSSSFRCKHSQQFDPLMQRFIRGSKADAKMRVAAAKDISGDNQQPV